MPLCYILVCYTFRQAEGYTTLLYLSLSYISKDLLSGLLELINKKKKRQTFMVHSGKYIDKVFIFILTD